MIIHNEQHAHYCFGFAEGRLREATWLRRIASYAGVAELVDAPDSKSGGGDIVWVQVPSPV